MDDLTRVYQRWSFHLPNDYRRFWDAGILDNDPAKGLKLSRFRWLSPSQIAECPWPEYKIRQLVPFALTPGRDHYCWFVESDGSTWCADCPHDSDIATGYSPTFEGFVYRSLLEEFANTWLGNTRNLTIQEVQLLLSVYTERVATQLPLAWVAILRDCAAKELKPTKWGTLQTISAQVAKEIIDRDLTFPMLNKEFRQHTP